MHVAGGGGGSDPGLFEQIGNSMFQGTRALVNTWVNSGGTAQQASFSVDIEQIPGLIAKYEEAQRKLRDIQAKAQQLEIIGERGAPGNDEVSRNLAKALGRKASMDEGCLAWAVTDGYNRLQDQVDQLKQAKHDYEASDETATPRIQT